MEAGACKANIPDHSRRDRFFWWKLDACVTPHSIKGRLLKLTCSKHRCYHQIRSVSQSCPTLCDPMNTHTRREKNLCVTSVMLCWGTCSELWQLERKMWRKTLILYLFCMQNALSKNPNDSYLERNGHTSIGKKKKKDISYWPPQNSLHNCLNKNELKTWTGSFQNKRKIINKYIKENQTSLLIIPAKKITF